jgi:CRP/FNR family cyclic AMP-dependent transcriptional regulator
MLGNVPLFSGLSEEELQTLEAHSVTKNVRKNTVIIDKGDETSSLYVIVSGKVKVYLANEQGKEIILNIQGSNDYFGELALLAGTPRNASVMTLQDSQFMVIKKWEFSECLINHPEIALNLVHALVERVSGLTESVNDLALHDVYERVTTALRKQAAEQEGKLVVEALTQQDLAHMVGATRQMVNTILKDLKAGGYLSVKGKQITINRELPPHW